MSADTRDSVEGWKINWRKSSRKNKETDARKTQELQCQTSRGRKREGERRRNRENGDDCIFLNIV